MGFPRRRHVRIPELAPGGYPLAPLGQPGWFSVITPLERINLETNPSFELGSTSNFTTYQAGTAFAVVATRQRRGAYSMQVTPGTSGDAGALRTYTGLTASTSYAYSEDLWGEAGRRYAIQVNAGGSMLVKAAFVGLGFWQRIWVVFNTGANTTVQVYTHKDGAFASSNVVPYYLDGIQLEEGSFPTTYIDGDQLGFVVNQVPPAYYWTGTPHASASVRSGQTRAGGRVRNLQADYDYIITQYMGLGMEPRRNLSLPVPAVGGSLFQRTVKDDRQVALIGEVRAADFTLWQKQIRDLEDAIKDDTVTPDQPLVLRYQSMDEYGRPTSEEMDIVCHYVDGLGGDVSNLYGEPLPIRFEAKRPMVLDVSEEGTALSVNASLASVSRIVERSKAGVWSALGGGTSGGTGAVWRALYDPAKGRLYVTGDFTSIGGVSANRIAYWDGTAWNAMGTGLAGGIGYALAIAPDGTVYVAGAFTSAGGVANTSKIAGWSPATTNWGALGASTGLTGGGAVGYALALDPAGMLWIAGDFTTFHGSAALNIASFNITTGTRGALGTGLDSSGLAVLAVDTSGPYVGGNFTTANGVTVNKFAKWNGTTFVAYAGGLNVGNVQALARGPGGLIYVAGADFTTIGGIAASGIAAFNGTGFQPLGSGVSSAILANAAAVDNQGRLYVGGDFTIAGGLTLPDKMAMWNGTTWVPLDIDLPGISQILTLATTPDGRLFVGSLSSSGTATAAAVTTVTNSGKANAYPIVTFTGPGTVYQLYNFTTGKAIYFNLTLLAGETATLVLDPLRFSFISSYRGDIASTILAGSQEPEFFLQPGANSISLFMTGTTGASAAVIWWKKIYHSLRGGVR